MRVGFPIAFKLMLATGLLVLSITVGVVIAALWSTESNFDRAAMRLKRSEIRGLRLRGLNTARQLADSLAAPMLEGDAGRVQDIVGSVARGDDAIVNAIVVDDAGRVVGALPQRRLGDMAARPILKPLNKLTEAAAFAPDDAIELRDTIAFGAPIAIAERRLGSIYLEASSDDVRAALAEIVQERRQASTKAVVQALFLGLLAFVFGAAGAVFLGLRFGTAVNRLSKIAKEVGEGNLKARAKRETNDEIGFLCDRINEMTNRIETLMQENAERAALANELEQAMAIQQQLLPQEQAYVIDGLSYAGRCRPAAKVGGDWWYHYPVGSNKVVLCVGDVTGHGLPSALLTASAKACCDTLLSRADSVDLLAFMQSLNTVIREAGKGELTMTLFAAAFDMRENRIDFVNAGHNFPLLLRNGSTVPLVARGSRLGDGKEFGVGTKSLKPGDMVMLYTDGIVEGENARRQAYGLRRLRTMLHTHAHGELLEAIEAVLSDAHRFVGDRQPEDDITLVLARFGSLRTQ